jgi:hypothetical protein
MQLQLEISEDPQFDDENDYDLLDRCQSLTAMIEIGELHERDKFSWSEQH